MPDEVAWFEFVGGVWDGDEKPLPAYVVEWLVPVPPREGPRLSATSAGDASPVVYEVEVYRREGNEMRLHDRRFH